MALYHLSVKMIKRSAGQSSVASAAYRRATILLDEHTGVVHHFSRKRNVIYSEIFIPDGAPQWIQKIVELQTKERYKSSELLWNSVEKREKRVDAQLAREVEFALPIEFNKSQCIELTEVLAKTFTAKGMVVDVSIHWDKGNPHAHFMLSTRQLEVFGWGLKERAWNEDSLLMTIRENAANLTNQWYAKYGIDKRVSHLSYADQGTDLTPMIHEGQMPLLAEERRAQNQQIRLENLEKIRQKPDILLDKIHEVSESFCIKDIAQALSGYVEAANSSGFKFAIGEGHSNQIFSSSITSDKQDKPISPPQERGQSSSQKKQDKESIAKIIEAVFKQVSAHDSVFDEKLLKKVLARYVKSPDKIAEILVKLKQSPELLAIGPGEDGRERYTTRHFFELESGLQTLTDTLYKRTNHKVTQEVAHHFIQSFKLEDEQAKAIEHILRSPDITAMVGRAGTGKSYSLKAARAAWEASGFKVHGIALAGIAAENLEQDSDIKSCTIASFKLALEQGTFVLTDKDIVVMDEAGMTDSLSFFDVLTVVHGAKAKLVLVGDPDQLPPVGPGAAFRALLERIGFVELSFIRRQEVAWQREATVLLARGEIDKALSAYEKEGCITLVNTLQDAKAQLIQHWYLESHQSVDVLKEFLILAYKNDDVDELNILARQKRVENGMLLPGETVKTSLGTIFIAVGDRLRFLKNQGFRIRNGQRGTILSIKHNVLGEIIDIAVLIDAKKEKIIHINPKRYPDFTYGYATTVHRAQGVTIDRTYILATGYWNRFLTYVAMTRHRKSAHLYADKKHYPTLTALKKSLSRWELKDSVLDYPLAFAERRGIKREAITKRVKNHLVTRLKGVRQTVFHTTTTHGERNPTPKIQKILEWREHARVVASYVDANQIVKRRWQELSLYTEEKGFDLKDKARQRQVWALFKKEPVFKAFKAAEAKRDALAFRLQQNPELYTKAIDIHGIDLKKLERNANNHVTRGHIEQYIQESEQGRVVHRDKWADLIQNDFKEHYGILVQEAISTQELKVHAKAHQRRTLFIQYTELQRNDFRTVEHYIKLTRHSARLWSYIIKEETPWVKKPHTIMPPPLRLYQLSRIRVLAMEGRPLSRAIVQKALKVNEKRDKLAYQIYQDISRYQTALQHYEIGQILVETSDLKSMDNAPQKNLTKFERNAIQEREKRFKSLKKQALQHQKKEAPYQVVKAYLSSVSTNHPQRYVLAKQIVLEKQSYKKAIFDLAKEPVALWAIIYQDNKVQQRNELFNNASPKQKAAFLVVEDYFKSKESMSQIWVETKFNPHATHKIIKDILATHRVKRDALAATIHTQPELYTKALKFYGLNLEEIAAHATQHEARQTIIKFKKEVGNLSRRVRLAKTLLNNPLLTEMGLSTSRLAKYARYADRLEKMTLLSPTEREDDRVALNYQRFRREAGRAWGEIFRQKETDFMDKDTFNKAIRLTTERDYLAYLITLKPEKYLDFMLTHQVVMRDLEKHSTRHIQKIKHLQTFQLEQEKILNTSQTLIKGAETAQSQSKLYIQHQNKLSALLSQGTTFQNQIEQYSFALKTMGVSKEQFIEKLNLMARVYAEIQDKRQSLMPNQTKRVIERNPRWDLTEIMTGLTANTIHFTREILGDPNPISSTATVHRYGSNQKKGSLIVNVSGPKAGLWYDFQTGEGGNLLQLLQKQRGYSFKEAVQYAEKYLNLSPGVKLNTALKINDFMITRTLGPDGFPIEFPNTKNAGFSADQKKMIRYAQKLVEQSIPIEGTIGEEYLRVHRKITGFIPKNFRFNFAVREPGTKQYLPALLVIARNEDERVQAAQCIFLDKRTANKANISTPKRTYGPLEGASILIQAGRNDKAVALAEGPETALSIAEANQDISVYATLSVSNIKKVPLGPTVESVVICSDNDGANTSSDQAIQKAIEVFSKQGINVWIAKPSRSGEDFNDVLKKEGAAAVSEYLKQASLVKTAQTTKALEQETNEQTNMQTNQNPPLSFKQKLSAYNKQTTPRSLQDIFKTTSLYHEVALLALKIEQEPSLVAAAKKQGIYPSLSQFLTQHREKVLLDTEAKTLALKLKTTNPIQDYLDTIKQQKAVNPPWISQIATEKEQWHALNTHANTNLPL